MKSSEKIRKLRESLKLTRSEFAKRLNYTTTYIYQLEKGLRNAGLSVLQKIAETFNVSIMDLVGDKDKFVVTEDDESILRRLISRLTPEEKEKLLKSIYMLKKIPLREIPILGYVSAGEPLLLQDILEPIDSITIPEDEVKGVSFGLFVKGDSMKDLGIDDGDILLVSSNSQVESGSLVIAIIDNMVTFKKLKKEDGKIFLVPANENYEPIELTPNMDIKLYKVIMAIKRKKF